MSRLEVNSQNDLKGVIVIEVEDDLSSKVKWSDTLKFEETVTYLLVTARSLSTLGADGVKGETLKELPETQPIVLYLTDRDRQTLLDALSDEVDFLANEKLTNDQVDVLKGIMRTLKHYVKFYTSQPPTNISGQSDE